MGQSVYDPGSKNLRPWNAGRQPGAKRPLKPQQVWTIRFWLEYRGGTVDDYAFPSRSMRRLWHAFAEAHEGFNQLQGDRQSESGPVSARTSQDRAYGSVSRR
jgi:hypothetical protein